MCAGLLLASPGRVEETLDAYVSSISQLARPCWAGSELPRSCRAPRIRARGSVSRSSDRSQHAAASLQDSTARVNRQPRSTGLPVTTDPLASLYGLAGPKPQARSTAARATQPPSEAEPPAAPGLLDAVPRLGSPPVPAERLCRWQRSRRRVALHDSVPRGWPGRPQRPCLPVIYEL